MNNPILIQLDKFRFAWEKAISNGEALPNPCDFVPPIDEVQRDQVRIECFSELISMRFELTCENQGQSVPSYRFSHEKHPVAKSFLNSYPAHPTLIKLFVRDFVERTNTYITDSYNSNCWVSRREYLEALPFELGDCWFKTLALELPERFASFYDEGQVIGQGGIGQVGKFRDRACRRFVAIKQVLRQDDQVLLENESLIHAMLEHPNILPVYNMLTDELGNIRFVMRLIEQDQTSVETGFTTNKFRTLRDEIEQSTSTKGKKIPLEKVKYLVNRFSDICNAVAYAHSKSVVHRDINPKNIFIGSYNETLVSDWGLAFHPAVNRENDKIKIVVGTSGYQSNEQMQGEPPNPSDDVYSLGIVLKEILAGQCVHYNAKDELVIPDPPKKYGALNTIADKATKKERKDRYPSAKELKEQIDRWLNDDKVVGHREKPIEKVSRWVRKSSKLTAVGIVATAILLASCCVAYVYFLYKEPQQLAVVDSSIFPIQLKNIINHRNFITKFVIEAAISQNHRRNWLAKLRMGDHTQLDKIADLISDENQTDQLSNLVNQDQRISLREFFLLRDQVKAYLDGISDQDQTQRFVRQLTSIPLSSDEQSRRTYSTLVRISGQNLTGIQIQSIADVLCKAPANEAALWVDEGFLDLKEKLVTPLEQILKDASHERPTTEQSVAVLALARYQDQYPQLARTITQIKPELTKIFLDAFPKFGDSATSLKANLATIFNEPLGDEVQASRQRALAALALLRLGDPAPSLHLLDAQNSNSSSVRAHWIHFAHPVGVEAYQLSQVNPQSPHGIAALYLTFGECVSINQRWLDQSTKKRFIAQLEQAFKTHADSGVHAASDWTLRQLLGVNKYGLASKETLAKLHELENQRPKQSGQDNRSWFVNKAGQTMVVFHPAEFDFGDDNNADHQGINLPKHRRKINRKFAISTREVTAKEFEEYCHYSKAQLLLFENARKLGIDVPPDSFRELFDNHRPAHDKTTPESRIERQNHEPVTWVSWYHAVAYCNWLSKNEGLQPCYPDLGSFDDPKYLELFKPSHAIHPLNPNSLKRNGYRLPTEAEWEFACRAGTQTRRPFGDDLILVPKYATFRFSNAAGLFAPVGSLKPNEWGLFDMLGNAQEFCHEPTKKGLVLDNQVSGTPGETSKLSEIPWIVRGGSKEDADFILRSAYRHADGADAAENPKNGWSDIGFRVARTLP